MRVLNICSCCGQALLMDDRPVVNVDDALLELCNEAYAAAEARMSAEVRIADLVWCLARSPRWRDAIARSGAAPDPLVRAAESAAMRRGPRGRTSGVMTTSDDLKTLLRRAERRAIDGGKRAADVPDFLSVLFLESRDVADADFVRDALRQPSGHATTDGRQHSVSRDQTTRSSRVAEVHDIAMISDRLAAQERQNGRLLATCDRLSEQIGLLTSDLAGRMADAAAKRGDVNALTLRLQAQDRRIAELQQSNDALAHQLAAAISRLTQASDGNRSSEALLADLLARIRSIEVAATRDDSRGISERSRRRRSRRRKLRLRSRQRRRRVTRSARGSRASRPSRQVNDPRDPRPIGGCVPALHAVPRASYPATSGDRFEPVPRALVENRLPARSNAEALERELADEMAEPIESEEDLELEGQIGSRPKRFYLTLDDDIERAPSIGPRTAERLSAQRVATVRDLLACDPQALALRVQSRYVSAERLAAWKSQARLVCTVPWLRGTHAQLLVGAGFDTLDKLSRASTSDVCAGIAQYASTRDGQSVLRAGPPPAPERIAAWMGHVMLAEPERARLAA